MKKDPDFGDMDGLAETMLKAFPEIIESTTKVEIGLNLSLIHIFVMDIVVVNNITATFLLYRDKTGYVLSLIHI